MIKVVMDPEETKDCYVISSIKGEIKRAVERKAEDDKNQSSQHDIGDG